MKKTQGKEKNEKQRKEKIMKKYTQNKRKNEIS